jgi:hemerythrin-like domain-containing protein
MGISARKTEQFLHFGAPAGYDDPVGMLQGCHRRIEKKLSTLRALCTHLATKGIDAEASVAAQAVLRYFDTAAGYHHQDEEIDLLPLLAHRVADANDRARLEALTGRIHEDHAEVERIWARLRKPLEGIADGLLRSIPMNDVNAFAALYRQHIEAEEGVVIPLARKWMTEDDLAILGRSMATRRGASFPVKDSAGGNWSG